MIPTAPIVFDLEYLQTVSKEQGNVFRILKQRFGNILSDINVKPGERIRCLGYTVDFQDDHITVSNGNNNTALYFDAKTKQYQLWNIGTHATTRYDFMISNDSSDDSLDEEKLKPLKYIQSFLNDLQKVRTSSKSS